MMIVGREFGTMIFDPPTGCGAQLLVGWIFHLNFCLEG